MDKETLKEGIKILYETEQDIYFMEVAIQKLKERIAPLGIKANVIPPQRNKIRPPYMRCLMTGGFIGLGICLFIYILLSGFLELLGNEWEALGPVLAALLIWLCVGIGLLIGAMVAKSSVRKRRKIDEERFKIVLNEFNKFLDEDNRRVKEELQQKEYLIYELNTLMAKKQETENLLTQYYEKINIDEGYRNIIPIGYMDEFIRLGVSSSLTGVDGLYYLVKKELRYDDMNRSMQEISQRLDAIIDNQRDIYSVLTQINGRCEEMIQIEMGQMRIAASNNQLLQDIAYNTSISAYNSKVTARQLTYQNFMKDIHRSY